MADKGENAEKEDIPPKKRHLSLSLNKDRCFGNVSEDNLQSMATFTMPNNSARASKWATTNFRAWFADYNLRNPEQTCPGEVLLPSCSKELLNKWLCVYVAETRSKVSNPYLPKTSYALCGILREMRVANLDYPNFLNKDDPGFRTFYVTLDNLFKSLHSNGLGSTSSHAEVISREEETALWDTGVLNVESPMGLLLREILLFERRRRAQVSLSQLERLYQPDRNVYCKNASKNRQGGL